MMRISIVFIVAYFCFKPITGLADLEWDRVVEHTFSHSNIVNVIEWGGMHNFSLHISSSVLDYEATLPSIVALWFKGERRYVELLWWKKDDRLSRLIIMALYAPEQEDDPLPSYLHCSNRYNENEKKMREEEIRYVIKNRSKLTEWVLRAEEQWKEGSKISPEASTKARRSRPVPLGVAKARQGHPL